MDAMVHPSSHRARRRFGQHWLHDQSVLDRIAAAAELSPADRVLEIGPGRGALTAVLLAAPIAVLHAIELDRDLVDGLRERFGSDSRFALQQGDALELPLPEVEKVVANIPYNITGPLLQRLLGRLDRPAWRHLERLVLLVQHEVAERLRARPGSSAFGALSVRVQLLAEAESVCLVPPRCFRPPPRVMSEVIRLRPHPQPLLLPGEARRVEQLLGLAFASRRKMLRNTLASLMPIERLADLAGGVGIRLDQRPQELTPGQWVALARALPQDP
jgi:16S rRNA (adenine1518-N6/adenine1519-N6)-dimethyltransferase